jgi:phytoene dehydrogenase-like protein
VAALNRRDLLRFALGAPTALLACRSTPRRQAPAGDLLDFGMKLGHMFRDDRVTPAEPTRHLDVLIVGAGASGLSCAWRLRKAGFTDFEIIELQDEMGGTARSGQSKVTRFPWAAHYITAPLKENQPLIGLLNEMGALEEKPDAQGDPIVAEHVACRAPEERVFYRGMFYEGLYLADGETPLEREQRERFEKELGVLAATRSFSLPRATSTDEFLHFDRQTFAQWMDERGFTSWRLRWLCDYACRDDYGLSINDTSAWAGLFYFCARRRAEHDERPVLTWPEGNGALIRHLARDIKVQTGRALLKMVQREDGIHVVTRTETSAPETWRAQRVVLAVPEFVRQRILGEKSVTTTSAWVVANIHLRARPRSRGVPFAWDTVLVESPSLGYVTATHQSGRDTGPTVLTWYLPVLEGRAKLLSLGQREWAEVALSDIEVAHPGLREIVERVDVGRWGHAMIRPTPGTFSIPLPTSSGRALFAHTDLSGMALFEESFHHGVRAAEAILKT